MATPLVVVPRQVVLCGGGLIGLKRWLEPSLEWLPFRFAKLLCRGMGLTCTVATKESSQSTCLAARTPVTERTTKPISSKDVIRSF